MYLTVPYEAYGSYTHVGHINISKTYEAMMAKTRRSD